MRVCPLLTGAVLALAIFAGAARADTLKLKDGRSYTGKLLEVEEHAILFEAEVGSMRIKMRFSKYEIESLEENLDEPPRFEEEKTDGPAKTKPSDDPIPQTTNGGRSAADEDDEDPELENTEGGIPFIVIDIHGPIGILPDSIEQGGVTASGLDRTLDWARTNGVAHVVFDVDSPGGLVAEADAITDTLAEHSGDFMYVSVVRDCLSAALVFPLSSEYVFAVEGGRIGAALSYSRSSVGNVEVDSKFNSAWSARLRALADRNHHDSAVVRAMVETTVTFYAWESKGRIRRSEYPPQDGVEPFVSDGPTTLVTLTSEEAIRLGLAYEYPGEPQSLAEELEIEDLRYLESKASDFVRNESRRLGRYEQKRREAIEAFGEKIEQIAHGIMLLPEAIQRADMLDPNRLTLHYNRNSGTLTSESQAQWRQRSDQAIAAWKDVLKLLDLAVDRESQIRKMLKKIERMKTYWAFESRAAAEIEACHSVIDEIRSTSMDLEQVQTRAKRTLSELKSNRRRTRL